MPGIRDRKNRSGAGRTGRLRRWLTIAAQLCVLGLLVWAGNAFSHCVIDILDIEVSPRNEQIVHQVIMTAVAAYAVLVAIPFVPGVEIGLALLVVVGSGLAILVYLATVAGLTASFLTGRFMPQRWLMRVLRALRLHGSVALLEKMSGMAPEARLAFLLERAPSRLLPFLLRHRYVALAALLNIPGNAVIGGGGGIAMIAGISGLYTTPRFLGAVALGVAPVPFLVAVFGATWLG